MLKFIESPKIRMRAVRLSLTVLRSLGIKNMVLNIPNKEVILPPDALYELLLVILREALKLSKDKSAETDLLEENLTQSYFGLLLAIQQTITPAEVTEQTVELLRFVFDVLKQESSIDSIRKRYFEPANLRLATHFLHYFELSVCKSADVREKIFVLYTAITALLRNLAIDVQCTAAYIRHNVIEKMTTSIELYADKNDLMLNTVRILSKISLNQECCLAMFKNVHFVKNIVSFFKTFKSNLFIIIRASFILASN